MRACPAGAGVNAVASPVGGGGLGGHLGEEAVEGEQLRVEFDGEFADDVDLGVEILTPGMAVLRDVQQERLQQDDAGIEFLADLVQDGAVVFLEGRSGGGAVVVVAAPDVIDSDENGDDGGLEREESPGFVAA